MSNWLSNSDSPALQICRSNIRAWMILTTDDWSVVASQLPSAFLWHSLTHKYNSFLHTIWSPRQVWHESFHHLRGSTWIMQWSHTPPAILRWTTRRVQWSPSKTTWRAALLLPKKNSSWFVCFCWPLPPWSYSCSSIQEDTCGVLWISRIWPM